MYIIQKFRDSAVEVYNETFKSNYQDFADIQSKLKKCTDVLCKDQYFGIVRIEKSIPSFCEWIDVPVFRNKKNMTSEELENLKELRLEKDSYIRNKIKSESLNIIAIVLESPHDEEFFKVDKIYKNIGPACGTTGENLIKWFPETVINYVPCMVYSENNYKAKYHGAKDIESGVYALILVNAIQYQCSLGEKTTLYRNKVFNRMWEDSIVQESFIERLKDVNPDVIINCCTKGEGGKKDEELKNQVQTIINKTYKNFSTLLLRAAHPSSYHFKNGLSWVDENEK